MNGRAAVTREQAAEGRQMQRQKAILAVVLGLAVGGTALAQEQRHDRDRDGDRARVQQNHRDQDRRPDQQRDRDRNATTWQWQTQRDRDRDDRSGAYRTYPGYPNGTYYPNSPSGRYPNGTYYPNGRYPSGTYGVYGNQNSALAQAQQIGYTDGINDARTDMAAGRGYHATNDANYRHANRGWNRNMIDAGSYAQAYRQAYLQGYQQAYQGQGRYGWPY